MEIASIGGAAPPPPIGRDFGAGTSGIATDVPGYKAVPAIADDVPPTPSESRARTDSWSERRVVIDPGTQELVTQTIDTATQDVMVQTPDRARLGMRAYIDDVTRRQEESARRAQGDSHLLPALMI